jgi:Tol biopolymer transport system component
MELVILHELAHIVHLDRTANPIGRLARAVFGRVQSEWPFFPSLGTPRWVIEGLATWYESALTGSGRVEGTYQEMQIRTAAVEGRFEDIGQASGESALWPGGNRPYAYGARFFEYLLDKHGTDRMVAFAEAVAGQWIPYRMDAAGKDAFGASLSDEWDAWREEELEASAGLDDRLRRNGPITEPERLTTDARWGWHPKVSPTGDRLVYVRSDGRSDIQLSVDAPVGGASRRLTRTNGLATYDWMPDGRLLVAQLEYQGPYHTYGDLYFVDGDGREERLSDGARLSDPSVGPDGEWAVAIQQRDGTNSIALVDLQSGDLSTLVPPDPDVHWAFPRISPDGRWIAASRWLPGAYTDVMVLDAETGRIVTRVTRDRAIDLAPAWSPDSRWLVWSSDRTGISNILAAEVDPESGRVAEPVMLTNVRTGVTYPSVDPSGSWLYFTGYHVDGWEVERVAFEPGAAGPVPPPDPRFEAPAAPRTRGTATEPMTAYDPGPTLAPHYWEVSTREPIVFPGGTVGGEPVRRREALGWAIGAETSGRDLVGRHAYNLAARVFTDGGKLEAGLGYAFAGLGNPILSIGATQGYDDDGQLLAGTGPDTLFVLERRRSLSSAATVRAPRWRHNLSTTLSGGLIWERRELLDRTMEPTSQYNLSRPTSRLAEVGLSAGFVTARSHSFQMGMTRGVNLFLGGRVLTELQVPDSLRSVSGVDRSARDLVGRARGAIPLWTTGRVTHVLALQATGGIASGPGAGPGYFDVGGASGQPESVTGAELFGGSFLFYPMRGYERSARFGRYAWTASAEYRFPLALINWGLGAWPVHLDRMVGAVFVDAGNAWGPDVWPTGFENPLRTALASVGAEITTEFLALFDTQLLLRVGVAQPLVEGTGARVYVRTGLPF